MTIPRVVFDCNVHFQSFVGRSGPADACLDLALQRRVLLYYSAYVINEFLDICSRGQLRRRFGMTDERISAHVQLIRQAGALIHEVPDRYQLRIDPDNSHYVNLALAADASLIVSRDRDLLRLRETTSPDGAEFVRLFPGLEIMEPPELPRRLAESRRD